MSISTALFRAPALKSVTTILLFVMSILHPALATHPLLDIQDALVTSTNPARNDGSLDFERCARLHNYLVSLSWMERHQKTARDLHELQDTSILYFSVFGDVADDVRKRLDPQLCQFLELIIVPWMEDQSEFFLWLQGIASPEEMQADGILEVFNSEDQQTTDGFPPFALLYHMVPNLGSHPLGVVYDQEARRVAFVNTIWEVDQVNPIEEHREHWLPLEHLLSHWIGLVHRGKITMGPARWQTDSVIGVWRPEAFGDTQVTSTVDAFHRLISAIELRMAPEALLVVDSSNPLLSDADMDAAGAASTCFARSFLTRVRTPRFRRLAPGIEVPHNAVAFASQQRFTRLAYDRNADGDDTPVIAPVLMFASAERRTVDFDSGNRYIGRNPFRREMYLPADDHATPAGLYSESIKLGEIDGAGEGFRLLLPFSLQGGDDGARLSDGSSVVKGSVADLFQHGLFPLGSGGGQRAQRLERLFDAWTQLVQSGVWAVGVDGVEGSMDVFKDADGASSSDYWIPLDTTV